MTAVDSPGSPGLTFKQLTNLLRGLLASGRAAGLDFAIYDPELDPGRRQGGRIVGLLATALEGLPE